MKTIEQIRADNAAMGEIFDYYERLRNVHISLVNKVDNYIADDAITFVLNDIDYAICTDVNAESTDAESIEVEIPRCAAKSGQAELFSFSKELFLEN